jgi:superfamily II RNA helicase
MSLPPVPRQPRGRGRGAPRHGRGDEDRNAVVGLLERAHNLPTLFFCFSRRECEQRARETLQKRNLLEHERAEQIERLFADICEVFEVAPDAELEELRALVRHGIAYHHAGMLPLHKELVERLFTSGLLQLLFATETFSLGINMPARSVVFASLRKFDGVGFSTLKVREYQQMAGRAGRQGIDEHGLVVSILDDDRVTAKEIVRLTGNDVEPILSRFNLSYSTLINLHRTLGDRLHEAWERSFNNFQWSRMSRRKREKNEEKQRQAIDHRLQLLRNLGYITDAGVTAKGDVAAVINGYELPVTELLESGLLEWLDEKQIAIVFAALVFEERKNELFRRMPPSVLGEHRKDVEAVVGRLITAEKDLGIPASIQLPNFKIGVAVQAWCDGAAFEDIRDVCTSPNGDLVRVMRLTVQLLRQLRSAIPRHGTLALLLERARDLLNRDEVDAARQLSLG